MELALLGVFAFSWSAAQPAARPWPSSVQAEFARAFSPRLLFHENERWFPCSPLRKLPAATLTAGQIIEEPGAVVLYRAYPLDGDPAGRAVVEYWLYYERNDYRGKSGLFLVWSDVSHPNDMEHIFLVLEPLPPIRPEANPSPGGYRVAKVLCGAHEINNIRRIEGGPEGPEHLDFLVELGSHSACPDLDRDGRYTPGVDGARRQKYCWGIRDRGRSWSWWRAEDADPRVGPHAVRLREEADESDTSPEWAMAVTYRLQPDAEVEAAFRRLAAENPGEASLAGGSSSRFKHFFGLPDGNDRRLWMPSYHENYGDPGSMERNFTGRERGLMVGYTRFLHDYTLAVGARYGVCMGRGLVPDVILESQAFLTGDGRDFYSAEAAGYYPLDRISNVFAGGGCLSEDWLFRTVQPYAVAGAEIRLGNFRVRAAYRTGGSVSADQLDIRFSYLLSWDHLARRAHR